MYASLFSLLEPWGHSDWTLASPLTSPRQRTGFSLFLGVYNIYSTTASILTEQSPVLPWGRVGVTQKADLLQIDLEDCTRIAQTSKWLKYHIFLPYVTLCHCFASI